MWILNKLKQMDTGIYKITNIITNDLYIGSAAGKGGFKERLRKHKWRLRNNINGCTKLQRRWNKYGEDNFTFDILEYCEPNKCIEREQYFLDKLKPSLNILPTAGSRLGAKQSDRTKEKISKKLLGTTPWNVGIPHSEETKRKMRKERSEETKDKISKAVTGSKNGKSKKVFCPELNIKFESARQAEKYMKENINPKASQSFISSCCRKEKQFAYGLSWIYID